MLVVENNTTIVIHAPYKGMTLIFTLEIPAENLRQRIFQGFFAAIF